MKKFIKSVTASLFIMCFIIYSALGVSAIGENVDNSKIITVSNNVKSYNQTKKQYSYIVEKKIFGIIPFSKETVTVNRLNKVKLLGTPFGIKLYSDGVLVVDIKEFSGINGKLVSPLKNTKLKPGDYILSCNGENIYSNKQFSNIIMSSRGEALKLKYAHNGKIYNDTVKPIINENTEVYQLGIVIKDSSAGLGTFTFYDESNNVLCGLGHGIYDETTNKLVSVNAGSIVGVRIGEIKKSGNGRTGEIVGYFSGEQYSTTLLNSDNGIYCKNESFDVDRFKSVEILPEKLIKEGDAQIICSLQNDKTEAFKCKINNINLDKGNKAFTVKITDKNLIKRTGGIIQGMSGSPIIQDGKLIGALTHVFVDNSTEGYAITAETMLETAQSVANGNKLKDAS